jgi:sterol desaturase/sphingolipid hydroxylase (fatty acid hydroxylase superfamily)
VAQIRLDVTRAGTASRAQPALWALFLLVISLLANWLLVPLSAAARTHGLGLLNLWPCRTGLVFIVIFCSPTSPTTCCTAPATASGALWLLHAVHHSDPRLDVSTSLRQHPLFFVATLSIRALLTVALGAPVEAHAVRDVCGVATSHLHHAAIADRKGIDQLAALDRLADRDASRALGAP